MNIRKIIFLLVALVLFVGIYLVFVQESNNDAQSSADIPTPTPFAEESKEGNEALPEMEESAAKELPKEVLLSVPFTPQAPTANWDELHNEACEEASVLMAAAFFKGDKRSLVPASEAEREIEKLTEWQKDTLGYYLSIDANETVQMIEEVYGLQAEVVKEFSEDSMKRALADQKLILVPVNGRVLGNPYFRQPGPIYHMFVITGYNKNEFIVNEPGTKRGQDYRYTYNTIRGAVGDYDHHTKETDPSQPAIIIVSK